MKETTKPANQQQVKPSSLFEKMASMCIEQNRIVYGINVGNIYDDADEN